MKKGKNDEDFLHWKQIDEGIITIAMMKEKIITKILVDSEESNKLHASI